jgi:hypothetical protein
MKVPQLRLLVVVVIFATSTFSFAAPQSAPNIEALIPEVQGKSPSEVRALIVRRLGPPARDVGSGFQIEQWDVDGGVLTFHSVVGPDFQKDGVRTRLIHTNNPVALCLFGSYEMVTYPERRNGLSYWLGDVLLSTDRFKYTDSHDNLDHRDRQRSNFFMLHPNGEIQVKYSSGVTPETKLEDLPDGNPVATVTFLSADRRFRETYRIVTNRTSMSLALEGKEMQFRLTRAWVSYWH